MTAQVAQTPENETRNPEIQKERKKERKKEREIYKLG